MNTASNNEMLEKLYTVNEIAEILHIHTVTVRRFIKEDKMSAMKYGREWRITQSMLMKYYRENFKSTRSL